MTTYYIEKDGEIVLADTERSRLETTLRFMPQFSGLPVLESSGVYCNGEIIAQDEFLAQQLVLAKDKKVQEATDKAYSFEEKDALIAVNATNMKSRASGIYHIEGNLTNNIKLSAYAASMGTSDVLPWNTKENVNVLLDKTACETLTSLMSQLNAKLWTVDFPTYLAQIEACQTAEEVKAIEIVYENPSDVVDINIAPSVEEDDPNGDK